MDSDSRLLCDLSVVGSQWLRDSAYSHGKEIAAFIDRNNIGVSEYGSLMDAAATGKHVVAHRLFEHHPITDLPLGEPSQYGDFAKHLLSDVFTRQGLPILPGELLENAGVLKSCDRLTANWNFINGFDILAGTVAVYSGGRKLKEASQRLTSVDSLQEFARELGIGSLELTIAISTCNPLLLIGASLQLTSLVRGLMNEGSTILVNKSSDQFTVDSELSTLTPLANILPLAVESEINRLSLDADHDLG